MWPQIPENISELTDEQVLRDFAAEVSAHAKPILAASPTPEFMAEFAPYRAARNEAIARLNGLRDARLAATELDEEVPEDLADTGEEDETEDEVPTEPPVEITDDEDETDDADEKELATSGAGVKGKGVALHSGKGGADKNPSLRKGLGGGKRDTGHSVTPDILTKKKDAPGYSGPGDTFASWRELAVAMLTAAEDLSSGSDRKHTLAGISGNFVEGRVLDEKSAFNYRQIFGDPEVMAAMCAH